MFLAKKEISNIKTEMLVNFEKVADDLLMVSITNQIESHKPPCYWRLTKTNGIPPLEIGLNRQQGVISCITLFIDGLDISEIDDYNMSRMEGNVIVDTSIFTKDNDYYDVEKNYDISVNNDRFICLFDAIKENTIAFRNGRLEIFVDSNNSIIGLSVCDLSEDENNLIKSIR